MNGSAQKLIKFMDGASKRFIIPVYQRNYDWHTDHCNQLFDDLVKVIRRNRKSHFFGSIVSVQNENGNMEEYLIIDGQQRLTTVSLLLLAIYHLLSERKSISQDPQLTEKILKKYLIDEYEPDEKRIKLKPIKNDQRAFGILFEKDEDQIPDSNLTINYKYFYNRIRREELSIDELFEAICKLEIINISLNHEDNPQLIFESLNSTGLDLSEGDKIRNYVLMGLPNDLQEKYYEKYWNRIENYTDYDVSVFIRDYLSIKQQSTTSNYLEGFIGIGGIYLCCVANLDEVRTELNFGMPEKAKNKALFDFLMERKTSIENSTNLQLTWKRLDENISSKVCLSLKDIDLSNEPDWPRMAKFHVEGSLLIYNAFKDLLEQYFHS